MIWYHLFSLSDDGFEQSLGGFTNRDDADKAHDEWSSWLTHAYVDIREYEN